MYNLTTAAFGAILVCGVLLLPVNAGAADNAEILTSECLVQLNLGTEGCACIGDHAEEVLNEKQQELVVAMVTKDHAKSTEVRSQMTLDEIADAANFMMSAPQLCGMQ